MKITSLKNKSSQSIEIKLQNGSRVTISPEQQLRNIDIDDHNLSEIKSKVHIVTNLTEVR